jgi:hypothetical protein
MTKTEAERKAQAMMDQIKAGKTIFTKARDEWMIVGPAADITAGAIVTATKQGGETSTVRVVKVHVTATRQGTTYSTATFRNVTIVPAAPVVEPVEDEASVVDSYKVVNGGIAYGYGRRYASQRGATQYDDGSGRFSVQIWDES